MKKGIDEIHNWFSLSYVSYLVLPRSILQSAPDKWQEKFVSLLDELDELFDNVPEEGTTYAVNLRNNKTGRFVNDNLCNYDRGRRYIKPKKP